jgi:drug/metabolite transporter (DMT)-like permease
VNRRAWLLFALVAVLWGIPYYFIKVAVADLSPVVVVAGRVAIAALVLVPVAIAQGAFAGLRGRLGTVLVLSATHIVGPFLLITYGEVHISSSLTGLLIAIEPVVIALLAARLDPAERFTPARVAGLVVGFAGVVLLVGLDLSGDRWGLLGAGMVLLATIGYAIATIVVQRHAQGVPRVGLVAGTMLVSTVVLTPFALFTLPTGEVSAQAGVALVVLGLLCTAVALLAFYQLVAVAGSNRAGLVTYLNPAVAVVLGVVFLDEAFRLSTFAGCVLILVGCWLCTRVGGTSSPATTDAPAPAPAPARSSAT